MSNTIKAYSPEDMFITMIDIWIKNINDILDHQPKNAKEYELILPMTYANNFDRNSIATIYLEQGWAEAYFTYLGENTYKFTLIR